MESVAKVSQTHVVALPLPYFGHIGPMMQLCKVLACNGITITFVHTERNHRMIAEARARESYAATNSELGLDIRIITIPDGLPPDYVFQFQDASLRAKMIEELRWVFEPLMESLSPPPSCIISDAYMGWAQDVANKFAIPRFALWTSSAAQCAIQYHIPILISTGQLPLKRDIEFLVQQNSVVSGIPGLPPFYHSEIPSRLRVEDLEDPVFQFVKRQCGRLKEANGVLVNSFPELEGPLFDALRTEMHIHPVGPLLLSPFVFPGSNNSSVPVSKVEEEKCLRWLNAQTPSSVLYVCFGSGVVNLPATQVEELVLGLEASEQKFLFVFRIELLKGLDVTPSLKCFLGRTGDRVLVVGWAPQKLVLAHASVGGFLTHCGWNSVLESIANAVPMLCWPVANDQALNCRYVVDEWEIGLKVERGEGEEVIGKEEVKSKAKAIMEIASAADEHPLKKRIRKVRDAAKAAATCGGISHQNLLFFSRDLHGRDSRASLSISDGKIR